MPVESHAVRIVSADRDEITFQITSGASDGETFELPTHGMILPPEPTFAQFVEELLRVSG